MKHTLDAKNMKLGRVASKAAHFLMGKDTPSFARNKVANVSVEIVNASKADIREKKMLEKKYITYSGYPGGLKTQKMKEIVAKKGIEEVFKLAVYGMLPPNRLRARVIKNLIVKA